VNALRVVVEDVETGDRQVLAVDDGSYLVVITEPLKLWRTESRPTEHGHEYVVVIRDERTEDG
jgi:hypothetical protein